MLLFRSSRMSYGKPVARRLRESSAVRDTFRRPAVQKGARPLLRDEQFIQHGVVDGAKTDLPFYLQGNGDAEDRIAVGVVRRPVERIDDPAEIGAVRDFRGFFRQDVVIGKGSADPFHNQRLGETVHLRDEIDLSFVLDGMPVVDPLPEKRPRLAGRRLDEFPVSIHVHPPLPTDSGRHISIKEDKKPAGTVPPRIPAAATFLHLSVARPLKWC